MIWWLRYHDRVIMKMWSITGIMLPCVAWYYFSVNPNTHSFKAITKAAAIGWKQSEHAHFPHSPLEWIALHSLQPWSLLNKKNRELHLYYHQKHFVMTLFLKPLKQIFFNFYKIVLQRLTEYSFKIKWIYSSMGF
jgi:hypothetical protein